MSIEARNRRIIALAQAGNRPQLIARAIGVTDDIVNNVIRDARAAGIEIGAMPIGPGGPRSSGDRSDRTVSRPRSEGEPIKATPRWTVADDAELQRLHTLGLGITRIAAQLRKPYRMVIEAAERLGIYETRETARIAS